MTKQNDTMQNYDDTHPCSSCGTLISYLKDPPDSASCEDHQKAKRTKTKKAAVVLERISNTLDANAENLRRIADDLKKDGV